MCDVRKILNLFLIAPLQGNIFFCLLFLAFFTTAATDGCPDVTKIMPCKCSDNTTYQSMDCSGHGLTDVQMDAIITTVSNPGPSCVTNLQFFNMSGNALTGLPFLIPFKTLKNVDLSNNSLTSIDPTQLPSSSIQFFNVAQNPTLTSIDFSNSGFTEAFVNM